MFDEMLLLLLLVVIVVLLRRFSPQIYDFVIVKMTSLWYKEVLSRLPVDAKGEQSKHQNKRKKKRKKKKNVCAGRD